MPPDPIKWMEDHVTKKKQASATADPGWASCLAVLLGLLLSLAVLYGLVRFVKWAWVN
jgi:hypothetical protein